MGSLDGSGAVGSEVYPPRYAAARDVDGNFRAFADGNTKVDRLGHPFVPNRGRIDRESGLWGVGYCLQMHDLCIVFPLNSHFSV